MNIFIDTNVYLNFYHFSSDDLEELKKLIVAIDSGQIKLFITDQIIQEFRRNRENKIADALKKFNEQKFPNQFPQICKGYPEFSSLVESLKSFEEAKDKIIQKLNSDILSKSLGGDNIINELFEKSTVLETDDEIIQSATKRMNLGNPPGKNNSYGDALNWEALLADFPEGEDLYFITDDKDYISPIDENRLSEFLIEEWKTENSSNIFFFRKLSDFFRDRFPDIKLASELEKGLAISGLINSTNFHATHSAIARLSKFADFSDAEINQIVEASVSNSQIRWIIDDPDVKEFLENLIKGKIEIINPEALGLLSELIPDSGEADSL